jgi:hypothetical protein
VGERNESLRRKEEKLVDREGGGELGGESGVISTDRVGENDTGANSGAQPMGFGFVGFVEEVEGCDTIGCPDEAVLFLIVVFITIGLLRFISVVGSRSGRTRGRSERAGSGGCCLGRTISD